MSYILTSDGIKLNALDEDLYKIVRGFDGRDYILEVENGIKKWNVHNSYIFNKIPILDFPILNEETLEVVKPKKKLSIKKRTD